MKFSKLILVAGCGLLLQSAAWAQIYESEDAQGVPDFSDTPSQGAEVVDLPATNLMEAPPAEAVAQPDPEPEPYPAEGGAAPAGSEQQEDGGDTMYYGGADEDDPRARRREDMDRIDNALPGENEPGIAEPGHLPAAEPRAVEEAVGAEGDRGPHGVHDVHRGGR
ncbi:MAG: DUF4124 domain-containing protein [Pseudomonadales bacterium]|nr:DUF4124 domain-containing protein [Pseudomonadales bacterium]